MDIFWKIIFFILFESPWGYCFLVPPWGHPFSFPPFPFPPFHLTDRRDLGLHFRVAQPTSHRCLKFRIAPAAYSFAAGVSSSSSFNKLSPAPSFIRDTWLSSRTAKYHVAQAASSSAMCHRRHHQRACRSRPRLARSSSAQCATRTRRASRPSMPKTVDVPALAIPAAALSGVKKMSQEH